MAQWTSVPTVVNHLLRGWGAAGRWIGTRLDLITSLTLGVGGVWTLDQIDIIDFTAVTGGNGFASLRVGNGTSNQGQIIVKGDGTNPGYIELRSADGSSRIVIKATNDTANGEYIITNATQSNAAAVWTVPDTNGDAGFLMTVAAQTITGAKTFASSALKLQEAGSTDVITVAVASLAAGLTYTVPDAGGAAEFLMSAGAQTITGAKTFASSALLLQEAGSTDVVTIAVASLAAGRIYTIPDAGAAASFVMTAGAQTISGDLTLGSGANLLFSGTSGQCEINLFDNRADALSINIPLGNDLMVFTTTDGAEAVAFASTCALNLNGTTTVANPVLTSAGVGAVAGTGIAVQERGTGSVHKSVFTLTSHAITITDAAAAGAHGTTPFYTFPAGHIKVIGAHIVLTSIAAGAGGIDDDAELDIGIGTTAVATDNDELATTEQDILLINEKALVAGAATGDAKMGLTNVQIDGSSSAGTLNLNVVVDADDVGSNDTITLTGTITIFWINEGDD